MAGSRYVASAEFLVAADAEGDPATFNLAQYVIDDVPINEPPGPIPVNPKQGGHRTITLSVDNEPGTGNFYLAPPSILPTGAEGPDPPADPFETRPLTGLVVKSGTRDDLGPWDAETFNLVARALPGCSAQVTVTIRGPGG